MILLIDNYDSFVFNLARYFQRLGQQTEVIRNDAIDPATVRQWKPSAIVLSPGPCTPHKAGRLLELVRTLDADYPMLGVCLGHQAIGVAFGAKLIRAPEPMHGRTSTIMHCQRGLYANLPTPMTVCRYHSLMIDESSLPSCLEVTAQTQAGVVMGLAHRERPVMGVQFHPEAILTEYGYNLLANFLVLAGLKTTDPTDLLRCEQTESSNSHSPLPSAPVTF